MMRTSVLLRTLLSTLLASAIACAGDGGGGPLPDVADTRDASPDTVPDVPSDASTDADASPGDDVEIVRFEWEPHENTVVLDDTMLGAVVSWDDERPDLLTLRADAPGLDRIVRGSVLVAGISTATPRGLLRVVDRVESAGDRAILHTLPASIAHAFRSLDIEARGPLPIGTISTSDGRGFIERHPHPKFGGEVDWLVFDGDGNPATTEDRVRVHGLVEANPTFTFSFSFDIDVLTSINPFEIPPDLDPVDVDLRFAFDVAFDTRVDITAEGQASLSFEREIDLGTLPLPSFGTPPLVFTPMLKATGRVVGGAPGRFSATGGFEAGFGGGLEFSVDDGFTPRFSPPTASPLGHAADVEIAGNLRASVDAEIALLLWGIVGPKAGLEVWTEVEADVRDTPCWEARIGMDAIVGVLIEVFSIELADWDHRWPIASSRVASGDCPIGGSFDPPPPWSVALRNALGYVFAPDDATTFLSRAIDGRVLVAGQGSRGLFKLDPDGGLVWARAFRAEDTVFEDLHRITTAIDRGDTGLLATTDGDVLLWLDASGHLEDARRLDLGSDAPLVFRGAGRLADRSLLLSTPVRTSAGNPDDVAVLRLHPDGSSSAWRWGTPLWDDEPHAMVPWGDGFALTVTSTNFAESPSRVTWLLRIGPDGTLRDSWQLVPCTGNEDLVLRTAVQTEDGELVLGGYHRFSAPQAALVRVDPDGVVDWATFNGTSNLLGYDITGVTQIDSGSYLVSGTRLFAAPDDVFAARTDSVGRFTWVRTFGGSADEEAAGILPNHDGTVLFATSSASFDQGSAAWWISRLDVRDGAISFDPNAPVRVVDDVFVPLDACVQSNPIATSTTPIAPALTPAEVTEEAADVTLQRLR